MKVIKFRAWIPDAGMNKEDMFYQGTQYLSSFLRRIYTCFGVNHPSQLEFDIEDRLTQYTGLHDKFNKKDVYEHDIIKHPKHGAIKVEWDYRDTGWVCITDTYKKINLVEVLSSGGTVAGNIHENPELLL